MPIIQVLYNMKRNRGSIVEPPRVRDSAHSNPSELVLKLVSPCKDKHRVAWLVFVRSNSSADNVFREFIPAPILRIVKYYKTNPAAKFLDVFIDQAKRAVMCVILRTTPACFCGIAAVVIETGAVRYGPDSCSDFEPAWSLRLQLR